MSFHSHLRYKKVIYNSIQIACEITLLVHHRGVKHTQFKVNLGEKMHYFEI